MVGGADTVGRGVIVWRERRENGKREYLSEKEHRTTAGTDRLCHTKIQGHISFDKNPL